MREYSEKGWRVPEEWLESPLRDLLSKRCAVISEYYSTARITHGYRGHFRRSWPPCSWSGYFRASPGTTLLVLLGGKRSWHRTPVCPTK